MCSLTYLHKHLKSVIMELIDFVKNALKQTQDVQIHSDAWKVHVKNYDELKEENYNIENAWNELSWRYSGIMSDLRKITEFIDTWQTFED